jgi:tetratricopeptide (TPR) repeat protein
MALKSLEMGRNMGFRRGQAMVNYVLSEISQRQQAYHDALQYAEQSLALSRTFKDKAGVAFSLQRLGDILECLNQYHKAYDKWREGLEIARQIQHQTLVIDLRKRLDKSGE